jgi:hypothetical protein
VQAGCRLGAGWVQVGCERWRTSASASPTGVTPFSSLKAAWLGLGLGLGIGIGSGSGLGF